MTSKVKFSVEVETESNEYICMTGDDEKLGCWNPDKLISLQKHVPNGIVHDCLWYVILELPANHDVFYRYCVTKYLETSTGEPQRIIKRWETNIYPRIVQIKENSADEPVQINTDDKFGEYGGYDNVTLSWLSKQSAIQLRLIENPIHMHKPRHRNQTYSIKCVSTDYREHCLTSHISIDEDSDEDQQICQDSEVLVSVLKEGHSLLKKQNQFGEIYRPDDFMIFKMETLYPKSQGFQFEFYVHNEKNGSDAPRYIGYGHLLANKYKHTLSEVHLPIIGLKHKPIGEITVKLMIAKPIEDVNFTMECSYQSHWKHEGTSLDVGHRGMGSSYKKLALVRENTVASLNTAAQNGADLVEFDVMLTKDLHTAVFHDFAVCVTSKRKMNDYGHETEIIPIPVKDLTLEQLQSMKLCHLSSRLGKHIDIYGDDFDPSDVHPFPTLQQCFKCVDENLGFNIEIKYPLQDVEGVWEMTGFMDHNTYIDILLKAVFDGANARRIIFSSFDPESCILLQRKQNKYPVLFLSNGPTERYTAYMDPRAQGYESAMHFALSEGLLGIDLMSECLLRDSSIIKQVKDKGLVLFVWGEDNNDRENITLLREQGVQGIIYDRIDFYKPEKGKYFEVEKNVLQEMQHGEVSQSSNRGEFSGAGSNS